MMKLNKLKIIVIILIFSSQLTIAQEIKKHIVAKGETVTSIANQYKITVNDIYTLNPDVLNGLNENSILLIPEKKSEIKIDNNNQFHIVKEGETIYNLSKRYKTTPEILEKLNPELINGLKLEQKIKIPVINEIANVETIVNSNDTNKTSNNSLTHTVQAKETLYGIAKKYNLKPNDLIALNPEISENLPVGFVLKIKKIEQKEVKDINKSSENFVKHKVLEGETLYGIARKYNLTPKDILDKNPNLENGIKIDEIIIIPINTEEIVVTKPNQEIIETQINTDTHKVLEGETLYSISKKYDLTPEQLIKLNPSIKEGLQEGVVLVLKNKNETEINQITEIPTKNNVVKTQKKLNQSITNELKEISILIPFNIENQDIKSEDFNKKIKKDAFLNLALDFYSGALIAIDSLKKLKVNLKVNFIDSNESKNSSNTAKISDKIQNSNVIIGPFYQNNAEETANLFPNIPVVSPLSKENSNPIKNLYQSMPSSDYLKIKTFDYLTKKNGQIIALIEKNKNTTKSLIKNKYKNINILPVNDKGNFVMDSINYFLKKDKMNYLVLETSSVSFLLNTFNTINNIKSKGYDTQLIILDMNKSFESEEIFPKLYKQDFIYTSISKPNEENSGKRFNKIFKLKYNQNASVYAIRGFDVVFDTAIRITQQESFEDTANNTISNQLEFKFDYSKNKLGEGYVNQGIYFLRYSKDMKIEEVE